MGHAKKHATVHNPSPALPDDEDVLALNDDDLAAYARSLYKLVDVVSDSLKFRDMAECLNQTRNKEYICDIVTAELQLKQFDRGDLKDRVPLYRRKHQLPDPNQDSQAEVNRKLKKLNPRISPDHIDLFNELAELYPTKREALEDAIEFLAHARLEKD